MNQMPPPGNRLAGLRRLFAAVASQRTSSAPCPKITWHLAAVASMLLCSGPAAAVTVTQATAYWATSLRPFDHYTPGYDSADAAAAGDAAYYCSLPANASYFTSCGFGGLGADMIASIATNLGTFRLLNVFQYWVCPVGTQIFSRWEFEGRTYAPACVNWSAPPPPPPPPPKTVVIDPGHGFDCPAQGMPVGAIGVTDFLPNDPPAGRMREDELTMAIALEVQRLLPATKYRVILTKRNANACPSYVDRGRIANNANAKAFVSVHINAPNPIPGNLFGNGTSVLYDVNKSGSFNLADAMSRAVSSSLGVNNRGPAVVSDIAVLKPRVTSMNAVLLEAARLSGSDERTLHGSGAMARIAVGIKAALDSELGN